MLGYPEAAVPEGGVSQQPCPQWYFISLNAADGCCAHPNLKAVQTKAYKGGICMGFRILGSHSSAFFLHLLQGSADCRFILPNTKLTGTWGQVLLPQLVPTLFLQWFLWRRSFLLRCEHAAQGFPGAFQSCVLALARQRWRLGAEEEEQEEMWLGRGRVFLCHWDQLHFVS